MISEGLRGVMTAPVEERAVRQSRLVKYITDSLSTHNGYSFGYFFCEILNCVNVVINILMVDKFLGGSFMTYGTDVVKFSNMNQENRSDPMVEVFPRVTKCIFHKYGSSGSIQKHDALCVLALNILNEKIYIFLWFWFIILAVLSVCAIIYSAVVVMMPTTRERIIKRRFRSGTPKEVEMLIRKIQVSLRVNVNYSILMIRFLLQVGDFLLLHLLGQNINIGSYGEVLRGICQRIGNGSGPGTPSAPSTMEMAPIYSMDGNEKETLA